MTAQAATLTDQGPSVPVVLNQPALPCYDYLHELMRSYQVKDLVNVSADAFRARIAEMQGRHDAAGEGFVDPDVQERWAVEFHWGHHHDFGDFTLAGRMGKHHMSMLAVFIDELQALPLSLKGMRVLDIGCWTGGTSLLLAAMGATVVAVEEVKKYAACVKYLGHAFNVDRLRVVAQSLYDCTTDEFQNAFDVVLCAGVLHHLSDPKLALRILFNCLKDGGTCLLETTAFDAEQLVDLLDQPPEKLSPNSPRSSGWNAMAFTPHRFQALLRDVGFEVAMPCKAIQHKTPEARLFSVARRVRHVDLRRAGLSVSDIR